MSRNLAQQRAAFALGFIQLFRGKNPADQQKLATHVHKTAIRVLNHGLGQALVFLLADNKGKRGNERKPSGLLYDQLQDWLCGPVTADRPCRVYFEDKENKELIQRLMENDRRQYARAQEEILLLFDWLVKFTDAYLEGARQND